MVITFGFNMFMFGYDFSGGVFDEIFFGESSGCFTPFYIYYEVKCRPGGSASLKCN